jgi:hypothetical protein
MVIDRELALELLAGQTTGGTTGEAIPRDTTREFDVRALVERQNASRATEAVANGERVLQRLQGDLTRWFGPEGVDALFMRASDIVRASHPIMAGVEHRGLGQFCLSGIVGAEAGHAASAESNGDEVTEGIVVFIATIIALIGRLVGDDMAHRMIRQMWPEISNGKTLPKKAPTMNSFANE